MLLYLFGGFLFYFNLAIKVHVYQEFLILICISNASNAEDGEEVSCYYFNSVYPFSKVSIKEFCTFVD